MQNEVDVNDSYLKGYIFHIPVLESQLDARIHDFSHCSLVRII